MSSTVHMIVGSITLLLFLVNVVMYAIELVKGKPVANHRLVSVSAATGLLLQYALGFMLLGAGNDIRWLHWVIALVAIIPVGMEHGMTANQPNFRTKSMLGLVTSILTLVVVLIAYGIGAMG